MEEAANEKEGSEKNKQDVLGREKCDQDASPCMDTNLGCITTKLND